MIRWILPLVLLTGCDDRREQAWEDDTTTTYVPSFNSSPQCPAPGTPHAQSYQEHGGALHALQWMMLVNAMNAGPSYYEREVHHHHFVPASIPRPRQVQVKRVYSGSGVVYQPVKPVQVSRGVVPVTAPRVFKPSTTVTKTTTTTTMRSTRSVSPVPKSSSYGYRSTPTTFRSSPTRSISTGRSR
jgi:hypothetical protein